MLTKKTIWFSFVFIICFLITGLQQSHSALPAYYKEKNAFYDSLSIVLNKYIVPVGNWSLFEGTLQGLRKYIGEDRFRYNTAGNILELSIEDQPPLLFFKDRIDTNAIEMVESISKILDTTFTRFNKELDINRIVNAAISGMVATLEPNSYFIEPEDLKRIEEQNKGFFGGIGMEITVRDGIITIVSPYEGTPAFRQGLKPNDRIIAVNGISTKGLSIMEVAEKIRGDEGQPVTLTIERNGWSEPRDIVLVRDTISHRTVKSILLEPGFGYIRVINFIGTTDDDFSAALHELNDSSPLNGLVIDLRYNPGGLLNQALVMADYFLNSGVIATTKGRIKSDSKTFYARPKILPNDYPIVIIINGGSASGSEIFAASLRDQERAVLVGERSFGKGFIQAIFPVKTGGAIRLTTANLLTPAGDEIQGIGIDPDLHLPPDKVDFKGKSADNRTDLPTLELGATKNDPAVRISLDILKRSLLLLETSTDEPDTDITSEQANIKKRFNGLQKALTEVKRQQ